MKTYRILALALALIMALTLAACGGNNDAPSGEDATPQPSQDVTPDSAPSGGDDDVNTEGTTPPPTPVDPNERGNSASNITNGGIAAIKEDWIYFCDRPNGGSLKKIRTDGTEETTLLESGCEGGINIVGDWLYYTERGGISKMRTDGKEQTSITYFGGYPAQNVTVIGEWIYFLKSITSNPTLCKIKTDGSEETMLLEGGILDFAVVGDWIYYSNSVNTLCKMKTDGAEQSDIEVISDVAGFNPGFISMPVISGDYIFFDSSGLSRMNMDGTDAAMLIKWQLTELAADDGWVYYVQQDPEIPGQVILYKANLDGTEITEVGPSKNDAYYDLTVVGDWIYFTGNTEEGNGPLALFKIRTDGTEEQTVS